MEMMSHNRGGGGKEEKRDKLNNRALCASQKATCINIAGDEKPLTNLWDSQGIRKFTLASSEDQLSRYA